MQRQKSSLSDDFARHGRLRSVDQRVSAKNIHLHAQLILHEFHRLSAREPVPGYYCRGVYFRLYKLICASQKLGSDDHDRSGAIANLLILLLRKIDKYLASGMLNSEKG